MLLLDEFRGITIEHVDQYNGKAKDSVLFSHQREGTHE